jgi:hypothetical protein
MGNEENLMRKILQNEWSWLVGIILAVMGFVNTIILPIQKMQIQLSQIQLDITQFKVDIQQATTQDSLLQSRVDILETEIKPLLIRQ